jgi:hypothetical protein
VEDTQLVVAIPLELLLEGLLDKVLVVLRRGYSVLDSLDNGEEVHGDFAGRAGGRSLPVVAVARRLLVAARMWERMAARLPWDGLVAAVEGLLDCWGHDNLHHLDRRHLAHLVVGLADCIVPW